jgi:hypothetical protein
MKHPSEATLALYAGGDLGAFARWRTGRHAARCERCQAEIIRFESARQQAALLDELPGLQWDLLAAEMKANIRLGLAAGEVVRTAGRPAAVRPRGLVAAACVAALLVAGIWLQHPAPRLAPPAPGAIVENTADGISLRTGGQSLTLVNGRDANVVYSAGAHGVVRARYVDSETGQVTINNVYAY